MDDFESPLQSESTPGDVSSNPMERRLIMRLLRIWRDRAEPDDMPARERFGVEELGDSKPFCWTATVGPGNEIRFDSLGDVYAIDKAGALVGQVLTEAPDGTLIARVSAYAGNVVTWRVPMSFGGELKHRDGQTLLFRSIILPLRGRHSGSDVGHLIGAANYRALI